MTRLPEPGDGNGGINIGAIVGGAVGGFAALSATAFGIFFVWRKLKKDKARDASAAITQMQPYERVGKDGVIYRQVEQSELPEHALAEMSHPPQELDGNSLRHETSASPVEARRPPNERRASF
jgi:hypothetical protein